MAFDLTSAVQSWTVLVEINLGGSTLRYADRNLSMTNGNYYDGRVLDFPALTQQLGGILDPRFVLPSIRLTLDNADDAIRASFDANYGWAGKTVTVFIGQGNVYTSYQTRFVGQVVFPGGITWDEREVQLELSNSLVADLGNVPNNKFFPSDYPNVETKSAYQPIPLVYGSWQSGDGQGEKVPCYCYDTTAGTGGNFKISDRDLSAITTVFKNGVSVSFTVISLANATFTLDVTYDPAADTIEAHCTGLAVSGAGGSNTIADFAYDLLTASYGAALGVGRINAASFTAWRNGLGSGVGRRWIGKDVSIQSLLAELMIEGFADIIINVSDEYEIVERIISTASLPILRDFDLIPAQGGGRSFRVLRDPERTFANEVVAGYSLGADQAYHRIETTESTTSINNYGQRRRRRLPLNWTYNEVDAETRAARERIAFSTEIEMVELEVGPQGLGFRASDQFTLIYNKFALSGIAGTPFLIREITQDYTRNSARILAWNISLLQAWRYCADGTADYSSATAAEKLVNAYYGGSPSPEYAFYF